MTHPVEVHYREISAASDALWVGLPLGALLLCLLVAAGSLVPSSIGGPATPSPEAIAVGLSAALAALPLAALVGWSCGRAIRRSRYIGAEVAAAALGLVALVVLPAVGLAFGCAAWGLAPALPLAGLCAMVGAWLAERGIERVLEVVEEAEACSHAAREASQGLTPARPVPWGGQWRPPQARRPR